LRRDGAAPEAVVRRARRAIGRLGKARLADSYFTTFWLPCDALEAVRGGASAGRWPRPHPPSHPPPHVGPNPIEELVALLWKIAKPPRDCAGAEWWIGRAYTNALPIGFHFDQDVKARRGRQHPALSSVFFFNRVRGGQLAVTDQLPGRAGAPSPQKPGALSIAVPRRNRYVVFRGDRFHGVLDSEGRSKGPVSRTPAGRLRVTLVINFWRRRPTAVPLFRGPAFHL
jgi:hypothetical protein